jgi:hypothetical protein
VSLFNICNIPSFLTFALFLTSGALHADVGIVVYESKGVDARRTSNGHVALIATNLCAEGIDEVRACRSGEEPGVVVTRYANLAYGYDRSVFVAPIRDHFMATTDVHLIPALSSGGTLDAMQIEYWREHLRPYLPPLSEEQYQEIERDLGRFDLGRTFRKLISMELLIGVLSPQKKKYPTEPIALIDPLTQELIPNGRWREAIGAAHRLELHNDHSTRDCRARRTIGSLHSGSKRATVSSAQRQLLRLRQGRVAASVCRLGPPLPSTHRQRR